MSLVLVGMCLTLSTPKCGRVIYPRPVASFWVTMPLHIGRTKRAKRGKRLGLSVLRCFLSGKDTNTSPLQVVRESEKEGTWIAPPPFEENEITAKARENFADMNLEHLEEWVGWIAEGYRYASEESPYKPEHYKLLGSIKFGDLHKKHPHRSVTVDLITGKYRLGKAPQPVVNREYDGWQELKIFMRENA